MTNLLVFSSGETQLAELWAKICFAYVTKDKAYYCSSIGEISKAGLDSHFVCKMEVSLKGK